jgi:hypothetical protein
MKYLRRIFEEVNQNEYEQLKDFCEMYLAYLLDDGDWRIDIAMRTQVHTGFYDCIIWRRYEMNADGSQWVDHTVSRSYPNTNWDDISDYFIPFFKVLTDNYELVPSVARSMKDGSLVDNLVGLSGGNFTKEKILGNLIPGNQPARKITFKVKRKI